MRAFALSLLAAAAFGLTACDGTDPAVPTPLAATTFEDLPADPAGHDPVTGAPTGNTNRFTFFSLRTGEVVLNYDEADRADSASTAWDIAFRGTTVLVNGGSSGPGVGAAQVLTAAFDEVTEAPAEGYVQDASGTPAVGTWYSYSGPPNHLITPVAGRVFVIRTADGNYAKVRIMSYYQGAPAEPNAFADPDRYYTFEYVYQPDGSRNFETTTATD